MPRKPNYGFDKRRKEQDRKARKDAKKLDRQQRKEEDAANSVTSGPDPADATSPVTPPPKDEL